MLYEAAQILLVRSTQWSWLKGWAMQIARLRGMKKAIVALPRRLAMIMHGMVDGATLHQTREEAAAARGPHNIKGEHSSSTAQWNDVPSRDDG